MFPVKRLCDHGLRRHMLCIASSSSMVVTAAPDADADMAVYPSPVADATLQERERMK
jgi:hypothetical protein